MRVLCMWHRKWIYCFFMLFHNLLRSVDHHKHTVTQPDPWYSSSRGFAIFWDHYHCVELKFSHSIHDATASTFTPGSTICMFVLSVPSVDSHLFNLSPLFSSYPTFFTSVSHQVLDPESLHPSPLFTRWTSKNVPVMMVSTCASVFLTLNGRITFFFIGCKGVKSSLLIKLFNSLVDKKKNVVVRLKQTHILKKPASHLMRKH